MADHALVTLKLNKEFKHAYFQGKFKAHPLLVSYRVKNRWKRPRFGITTSKKIGCAVRRNRARRIIRQACRELLAESPALFGPYDFVFVARDKTAASNTAELKKVMRRQLTVLREGARPPDKSVSANRGNPS